MDRNLLTHVIFATFAILIFLLLFSLPKSYGQEGYRLLSLDRAALEYRQHVNYRDSFYPEYETIGGNCNGFRLDGTRSTECFKYGASALLDLTVLQLPSLSRFFWRNDFHMDATNSQVRAVGWMWEAGFTVSALKLEIFHRHHSRHILEKETPVNVNRYPVRDEYVFQFNFYKRQN